MPEQVKIGVVGTSWWADLMYLPILKKYERANLIAICGRNRERGEEMAAKFAIPQVFTDYREMIEQAALDAIVVVTPDDVHYPVVMAALDKGLHVLCDKPIALNADHARQMSEKAQAAHVKHLVTFTWSWLPVVQRAKQLVEEGYLGKPYHSVFHILTNYGRNQDYSWRFDADRANGIVADWGAHAFFMARWFLGDVVAVTARLGFHVQRNHPDGTPVHSASDSAWVTLGHASGAITQIELSAVAYIGEERTEFLLSGERGTVEVNWAWKEDGLLNVLRATQENSEPIIDERKIDLFDFFQSEPVGPRQFIDSILDDKPSFPGLYEGYQVQQVIDAALQSHQTGCRVVITNGQTK